MFDKSQLEFIRSEDDLGQLYQIETRTHRIGQTLDTQICAGAFIIFLYFK